MHDKTQQPEPVRSILIVAPQQSQLQLPLREPVRWPHFESAVDAKGVLGRLASFSPNVDFGLGAVDQGDTGSMAVWQCTPGLVNHLAMIDVLSTAAFLNDWNLRTGYLEFANPAAALADLIFQMKQLAALAIRVDECLYIAVRDSA